MEGLEEAELQSAADRVGSARTRHAFWTVLLLLLLSCSLLPDLCVLSVCLVLSLRVSNPWGTERLFTSVPRTVRAPLTPAQRQCGSLSKRGVHEHGSGSAGPRTVSRLAGWLSQHGSSRRSTRHSSRDSLLLHGCMAAWPLVCCLCSGPICQ